MRRQRVTLTPDGGASLWVLFVVALACVLLSLLGQ